MKKGEVFLEQTVPPDNTETVRPHDTRTRHSTIEQESYARVPRSILLNTELSCEDKCVYAALAFRAFSGKTSSIGIRLIARTLGINKNTVSNSLQTLARLGFISIHGDGKQRRIYHLTSSVFGKKSGKVNTIQYFKDGSKRLATIINE